MTRNQLSKMLKRQCLAHGSMRRLAAHVGVSAAHMSRVIRGEKEPGPKILDWFSLEPVVTYRKWNGKYKVGGTP